ncbi:hypothetical protein [Microbacterium sp. 77mftsu3.1]|uniref:hypothetical protein n=1 Tax=Microbacterium sp. 77mftsu3.1 TaxID=1761802 RepID=UPI000370FB90|nr:hypothetical protein [Microbacterium sp. 77mftsu3.1]SDH43212.1 hypothetical protein SAMN04488590_3329 [Microbacterium sp. 77mftsu3.1]
MNTLLSAAATPLPDFIAGNEQMVGLVAFGTAVGSFTGLGLILWAFFAKTPRLSVLILGLVVTVLTIGMTGSDAAKPINRSGLAADAVEKTYGVTIPDSAAYDLRYPRVTPDEGVAEQFGVTSALIDGQWVKVTLVWDGEQMVLAEADVDGLPLAPLR